MKHLPFYVKILLFIPIIGIIPTIVLVPTLDSEKMNTSLRIVLYHYIFGIIFSTILIEGTDGILTIIKNIV